METRLKEKADEYKRETDSDLALPRLREAVLSGWPENRAELPPELREHWNFRNELCICDGLLMKEARLITLSTLRSEMLGKIHSSHFAVEKCINRARELSIGLEYVNRSKRKWPSVKFAKSTETAKTKGPCYPIRY